MDKTALFTTFFQKTQRDEALLRNRFPMINGFLQAGGVPAAVLQNYDIARSEVTERVLFSRSLLTKYVDPHTGVPTPEPQLLPSFGLKSNLSGGLGAANDAIHALSPSSIVSAKDVVILLPTVQAASDAIQKQQDQLGFVPTFGMVVVAVLGLTVVVVAVSMPFIIASAKEEEVKLAEQKVELERQKNFATIWDTAQGLVQKCIGPAPSPDQVAKCWDAVALRFPDLVKAIPEHKLSHDDGLGFFGTIGLLLVGGAVVAGSVVGYRKWNENKQARERDERTRALRPATR